MEKVVPNKNIFVEINNHLKPLFYRIAIRKLYVILLLLFGITILSVYIISTYHKIYNTVYQERIVQLEYVGNFAAKILDHENFLVQKHKKTLKQAQEDAIEILEKVRFENADYIGIISDKGSFIYPPYPKFAKNPKTDAKIHELSKLSKGGFFQYKVTDINNKNNYFTKVSYVESYSKWHWIIVTGFYIDDINLKVRNSMLEGIFPVSAVLILLILFYLYVLWATICVPTDELTDTSLKLANSDLDVVIPEWQYKTEFGKLYRAFKKLSDIFKEKISNEKKVSQIIEGIDDVIVTADTQGIILSANPAVKKMFGYDADEIIGKNIDLLTNPSLFGGDVDDFKGIKCVRNKYELLGVKNEETFPIEVDVNKIKNNDDELFVLLIRNITTQKEIEKIKDEFVHVVGHEVKTPLMEIKESFESKLNYEFSNVETKVKSFINDSYQEILDLVDLIDNILDIENIEAEKIEFKYEVTNLFEIIEYAIASNKPMADKYKVNYQFINNIPKDTLIKVDKKRFCQLLTNVLSNASRYSSENSDVVILTSIKDNSSIQVSVKDSGTGIPNEFHDKIFTKFTRVSSLEGKQKCGVGLGMHICKKLVEKMNGRISFETELGKGTTFHISFPIYFKDGNR